MNKMVINHLERLFVTSDARTIVTELEVQHPAGGRLSLLCPSSERVQLLTALCAPQAHIMMLSREATSGGCDDM